MKKWTIFAVFAVCCLHSQACFSHENDKMSKGLQECLDASGGVTTEMRSCIHQEVDLQDKRLNEVYKAFMKRLPSEQKESLRQAQRLWIKYRDANCGFYFQIPGTMMQVMASDCVLRQTHDRANELEMLMELGE